MLKRDFRFQQIGTASTKQVKSEPTQDDSPCLCEAGGVSYEPIGALDRTLWAPEAQKTGEKDENCPIPYLLQRQIGTGSFCYKISLVTPLERGRMGLPCPVTYGRNKNSCNAQATLENSCFPVYNVCE